MSALPRVFIVATALLATLTAAAAEPLRIPVLVPITGFLALEGTSQRNGAELALRGSGVDFDVNDTATSPEIAVNAFERALTSGRARDDVIAVVAPMLGTQMLALIPLADEFNVPMVTVSGTARITELGSANVFRFFPGDVVVKAAHARYAVEELGVKRPAVIFQTTAYGQSGRAELDRNLTALGRPAVFAEGLDVSVKDMLPVLSKVRESGADALLLHLHSGPTALVVRQARAMGLDIPIIAGSAMHQPETAALLAPSELAGVCAESGASPISESDPATRAFADAYRTAFDREPDAFALGQYDGVQMLLAAVRAGAKSAADIRAYLASRRYRGLAMTYASDGKGNMAHSAVILCYSGDSRVPVIVKRYENLTGIL
ncbi:MAG: ABC transporter substrate-binding protein [Rhodospirillaceae bacterium]|jgi:branched-chain amino acid transport system substrate-binding protein|nr:ABC transporter substrate-binding protein [Rhodospirillaceae bacterium]MBT3932074.1 ABC transporter substrate-binding protein [Rhodospirillaceae bacterium]MBT4772707.1 ABC transporter substrate-binding protein [Rhodospirillaceae bacterium]MBT5358757.1 ABC transporter substrate-binding protein [Rhodospirillaceae bacterium]MBT5770833.1 ABC transporter substrate-binding protein [Rhodospirillaceae bacterium]